ncbi:hypothetical protein JZO77_25250 [Enterococcus hulanensis]|uniref:hypothetical protein n=1 Tax=Enterococcus hulanensis TaxID=2559929 RepID=UPI001A90A7A1|nr:hypothetical protein [Enterococcus hulanensis]MBO0460038.1 hypothetical protein [Enterococcus hulanensis]
MIKLYEIKFVDDKRIQQELSGILNHSIDILRTTRRSLLASAYQTENRRKMSNKLFKENHPTKIKEKDFLWACFSSEQTIRNELLFRSFYVRKMIYQEEKNILIVDLTYEKSRLWLELEEN